MSTTANGETAIAQHAELLAGCRDALRDYLSAAVPNPARAGYVHAVAGMVNGIEPGLWHMGDDSELEAEHRTGIIAAALNDLQVSEGSLSRPRGDPSNLRTKIGVLLARARPRRPQADRNLLTPRPVSRARRSNGGFEPITPREPEGRERARLWLETHPEEGAAIRLRVRDELKADRTWAGLPDATIDRLAVPRVLDRIAENLTDGGST